MKPQIIKDSEGHDTGVFIPIQNWNKIKDNYPDIESADQDLPEWEMDLIDHRLDAIARNPQRIKSDDDLLDELRHKDR